MDSTRSPHRDGVSGMANLQRPGVRRTDLLEEAGRVADVVERAASAATSTLQGETRQRSRMGYLLRRYNAIGEHIISQGQLQAPTPASTSQTDSERRLRQTRLDEARAAARRSELQQARAMALARQQHEETDNFAGLREAGARLAQVNEDLRNLLERPLVADAPMVSGQEEVEEDVQGRQKRRKLLEDSRRREHPSISYGYYGQVVPGSLKMQILSCDGGTLDSNMPQPFLGREIHKYAPENVLQDDDNLVYCTQESRCNLVLKHQGETTFDLERLVIKAPARTKYTDPVQEGLVFVAMDNDVRFEKTIQYEIHYLPTSRFAQHFPSMASELAFSGVEYAGSGKRTCHPNVLKLPSIHDMSSFYYMEPYPETSRSTFGSPGPDTNLREEALVDTHREMASLGSTVQNTIRRTAAINRRGPFDDLIRQHDASETFRQWRDSGEEVSDRQNILEFQANPNLDSSSRVSSVIDSPGSSVARPSPNTPTTASTENTATSFVSATDYLVPKARFSMHPGNDTMEIKFNPPVSCKYILLKLWSPRHDGNIDVRSIVAYGFAGVRWFPAVEMR